MRARHRSWVGARPPDNDAAMTIRTQTLDPTEDARWPPFLDPSPDATIFHHPAWLRLHHLHGSASKSVRIAAVDIPVCPVQTTVPEIGARRPLNGVLGCPRAGALGLSPLPAWDAGLERYLRAAGLAAAPA